MKKTRMRNHYDFSKMKGRKNPYLKEVKQMETTRIDHEAGKRRKTPQEKKKMFYKKDHAPVHQPHGFRKSHATSKVSARRRHRRIVKNAFAAHAEWDAAAGMLRSIKQKPPAYAVAVAPMNEVVKAKLARRRRRADHGKRLP